MKQKSIYGLEACTLISFRNAQKKQYVDRWVNFGFE